MTDTRPDPAVNLADEARALMKSCPLIDGHNDFPYMIRGWHCNDLKAGLETLPIGQTDIVRLGESGLGGQFWSAFVPSAKFDSEAARLSILEQTLQQIDVVHQLVAKFPDQLGLARTSADVWRQFHAGKLASLIGVEGLHQIAGRASVLRLYHSLGVRYVTLCHDRGNEYVDSATGPPPSHSGISKAGEKIVLEMNRIGMIIDLSHTSHDAQRRVLQLSRAPVMFSHSSAFTLCENPRNVPDDVLDQLKMNGGVCMICFLPNLCTSLTRAEKNPSVQSIVDHIVYVGSRIGYQHVGIGSDFDGMLEGPRGLDDVRGYSLLVEEMLRREMSHDEVKMVMGFNILRVLREVEELAFELQNDSSIATLADTVVSPWTDEQKEMLRQQGQKRGLV